MARDGSGDFSRVEGPYVNGNVADADEINAEMDDIADGLSDSINVAGTKAFGANQSMGGFRLTDLATPSSANDAARKAYVDSAITAAAQPLDATLTALAALSWSSGSPVLQFTAADTVSLTLTPSVTSVTTATTTSTTHAVTAKNTTDNASVAALRIEGDRATPANNDTVYASFYLSSGTGTQRESGRITSQLYDVTNAAEGGALLFYVIQSGAVTQQLYLNPFEFRPATNDTLGLGGASQSWADLFLASGGVINWNNGDVVITHSSDLLAVSGGDFQANLPLSSETSGTLTTASANKHILASGGITLPNSVFAARNITTIDGNGTSRTITRGSGVTMYVNGTDSATATLTSNGVMAVYWRTASICVLKGDVA